MFVKPLLLLSLISLCAISDSGLSLGSISIWPFNGAKKEAESAEKEAISFDLKGRIVPPEAGYNLIATPAGTNPNPRISAIPDEKIGNFSFKIPNTHLNKNVYVSAYQDHRFKVDLELVNVKPEYWYQLNIAKKEVTAFKDDAYTQPAMAPLVKIGNDIKKGLADTWKGTLTTTKGMADGATHITNEALNKISEFVNHRKVELQNQFEEIRQLQEKQLEHSDAHNNAINQSIMLVKEQTVKLKDVLKKQNEEREKEAKIIKEFRSEVKGQNVELKTEMGKQFDGISELKREGKKILGEVYEVKTLFEKVPEMLNIQGKQLEAQGTELKTVGSNLGEFRSEFEKGNNVLKDGIQNANHNFSKLQKTHDEGVQKLVSLLEHQANVAETAKTMLETQGTELTKQHESIKAVGTNVGHLAESNANIKLELGEQKKEVNKVLKEVEGVKKEIEQLKTENLATEARIGQKIQQQKQELHQQNQELFKQIKDVIMNLTFKVCRKQ